MEENNINNVNDSIEDNAKTDKKKISPAKLIVPIIIVVILAVFAGVVAALVVKAAPILGHGLFFPAGLSFYVFIKCHVVSCFLFGSFHFVSGDSGFC